MSGQKELGRVVSGLSEFGLVVSVPRGPGSLVSGLRELGSMLSVLRRTGSLVSGQ